MLKHLSFLLSLLLLFSLEVGAQDRNLKELFQETERDTLWVRDLAINCYIYFEDRNRLDSLTILSEIVISEANRLNFPWGQYHGNQLKGESFRNDYPDSTIYYAKLGIAALPKDDIRNIQIAYFNLGRAFRRFYQYDSAIHYLEKILPMAKAVGSNEMISDTYRLIGLIYNDYRNPAMAIATYIQALNLAEEIQDSTMMASTLMSIGIAYDDLQDYEKALTYMLRSAAIEEDLLTRSGNQGTLNNYVLNNIGRLYCKLGNYEEGMGYLYRDLNEYKSPQSEPCRYQYPAYNLGNAHLQLGHLDSAQYYLQTALELAEGCYNNYVISLAAHDLGQLFDQKGETKAAKGLFVRALETAEERNAPSNELINAAFRLYEISVAEGNYRNSTQYLKLWGVAKDSLFNLDKAKQLTRLEMEYSFESEKRELLAASEREQLILENKLEQRTIFQYALLAIAFLILLIALNYYRSNLRRKKANEIISLQNDELSVSAHQIRQLSNFKENMIAMIAHDMKNSLNTILGLSKNRQPIDDKRANAIQVAGSSILNLVSNMLDVQKFEEARVNLNKERTLMTSIMDGVKQNLTPLLQSKSMILLDETQTISTLNIDPEIIQRILSNLIANSVKYSPPGSKVIVKAVVEMNENKASAVISVIDQGKGVNKEFLPNLFEKFTQSEARSLGSTGSSGLGLHFCKLAVEAHEGKIWATSEPGQGLTVHFSLPMDNTDIARIKTEAPSDVVQAVPQNEFGLKPSEVELIAPYRQKLKELKIYQIKQIKKVIADMIANGLDTNWQEQVWTAALHGDQERFEALLNLKAENTI